MYGLPFLFPPMRESAVVPFTGSNNKHRAPPATAGIKRYTKAVCNCRGMHSYSVYLLTMSVAQEECYVFVRCLVQRRDRLAIASPTVFLSSHECSLHR